MGVEVELYDSFAYSLKQSFIAWLERAKTGKNTLDEREEFMQNLKALSIFASSQCCPDMAKFEKKIGKK